MSDGVPWLTRTELQRNFPSWGSPTFIDYMVRKGYLARRSETRSYRIEKRTGKHRRPTIVAENRIVWVYNTEQYVRYWEMIESRDALLAELREENGYQD